MTQVSTCQNITLGLGLGTLPPPATRIEPEATSTSRTSAWLLPARPVGCHGVMLGQGNTSTSPTFTPSLLFQVPRAIPSEGGPAPWGRGTRSWLLLTYRYRHPKGHREEQHWPHSMPWLSPPEQSGDTSGLWGGTQKIWEHTKGFPEAEPTITTPESSLVPAGILMVPRADLAAESSQMTFHPLHQGAGLQPLLQSLHIPSSLPARLIQSAGIGAGKAFSPQPPLTVAEGSWRTAPAQSSAQQVTAKGQRGAGKGDKCLFLAAIESFKYAH